MTQPETPRTSPYYYGELELVKRNPNNYHRQTSLPEATIDTYSTAGTIPIKEKEPLLIELENVGAVPLTTLETSQVRRSRSWYLCCPELGEEDISRESSWRYSSLRPVTAPPQPNLNGVMVSHDIGEDALRQERDALARALAAERARAAAAARATDARLAELHGVIAELMRRRAAEGGAAIPEEESDRSDECDSTTQPAGELDNDADRSQTDQNSSILSPAELPTPQESKKGCQPLDYVTRCDSLPTDDATDTLGRERGHDLVKNQDINDRLSSIKDSDNYDTSVNYSDKECDACHHTAKSGHLRPSPSHRHTSSCSRERGSIDEQKAGGSGRYEPKVASRVRLRMTDEASQLKDEMWLANVAEQLALDVGAQADLREALVAASTDASVLTATVVALRARISRLEADNNVLECALTRATDTAQRLSLACSVHESSSVALCTALRAADRALETYDVLLALSETMPTQNEQRAAAELIARRLLCRLDTELDQPTLGEPLLSPGPWLQTTTQIVPEGPWTDKEEKRLRAHAARLKTDTATLRIHNPPPQLYSCHDDGESSDGDSSDLAAKRLSRVSTGDMENAVMMQEVAAGREERANLLALLCAERGRARRTHTTTESSRRRHRGRHWLDEPSETDL